MKALDVCRRNFDNVRLDIAAWTTTGMVRTGNEDAFALLHGIEARMDDLWEYAMVLVCDGMGGYKTGEWPRRWPSPRCASTSWPSRCSPR